jgi:L-ascorbate metabolism protein UlaG (beta-lactamase superfamily)
MLTNIVIGMILLTWLVILIFLLMVQFRQTSFYQGPVSDHFDGKKFFNAAPYRIKTTKDSLRWMFTRQKAKWPKQVNDNAEPDLSAVFADNVKVTFVNHATVLVQTETLNFLTDPLWSLRSSPYDWIGPKRVRQPGVAFDDLPAIDVVLISHNHYDHLDLATLQKLNEKFHPVFLVSLGNKMLLTRHGIHNVIELDWWQTHTVKNAVVTFLPTQHWAARGFADNFKTLWGSFGIDVANKKIYFAGDSGYSPDFKSIRLQWGQADIAFIPIGAYEPEWFMQQNHLNPAEAVQVHKDLEAKKSMAIHFGTFQLSDESIDQPLLDLKQALKIQDVSLDDFLILKHGQSEIF